MNTSGKVKVTCPDSGPWGEGKPEDGPLWRICVLDLTHARAGPTCSRQLSDWGARVIRIEVPADDEEDLAAGAQRRFALRGVNGATGHSGRPARDRLSARRSQEAGRHRRPEPHKGHHVLRPPREGGRGFADRPRQSRCRARRPGSRHHRIRPSLRATRRSRWLHRNISSTSLASSAPSATKCASRR